MFSQFSQGEEAKPLPCFIMLTLFDSKVANQRRILVFVGP